MTDAQPYDSVIELLSRVPRPPEAQPWAGATAEQLDVLEATLGFGLPASLRTWLEVCNGVIAGPGGLYGTATGTDFLDIEFVLGLHPDWRRRKWIPVAGDGTGNHYVIDASHAHLAADGVFFVDVSEDPGRLAYVVASRLPRFLVFLLEQELGERRWPFDAGHVLTHDPDLGSAEPSGLLPWNG